MQRFTPVEDLSEIPLDPITGVIVPETELTSEFVDILGVNNGLTAAAHGLDWAFGSIVTIFGEDFHIGARIQAFEDRNLVETLAAPKVMILNNMEARIRMVRMIPYLETVTGTGNQSTIEVEFEESGVDISVTPIITPHGYVRMKLMTAQRIHAGNFGTGLSAVPIIDVREANTTVIVRGGETVMIGGLRQIDLQDTSAGVPWFRQIPVLGWFFKSKRNRDHKTELYLFVTPTIIEEVEQTTEQKVWYDRIDTKWHLPDYFYDDIKTSEDMD